MKNRPTPALPHLWIPGQGPDPQALERLQSRFHSMPREPMGEDWFMFSDTAERTLYTELMVVPIDSMADIDTYLEVIGRGTSSFGPLPEWQQWFDYLLPRVLTNTRYQQPWIPDVIQSLLSTFVTQYPDSIANRYRGFETDVMSTLGQAIMHRVFWHNGKVRPSQLFYAPPSADLSLWLWQDAGGAFSASMFFCWKYLQSRQIDGWLQSVFAIADCLWQAQLLVWLLGAHRFLTGEVTQPAQLDKYKPDLSWSGSHLLNGHYHDSHWEPLNILPFLPAENLSAFREALGKYVTQELFLHWIDRFAEYEYLETELDTLSDQFVATFLTPDN